MITRLLKIAFAACSVMGLLATVVAVNARQSWRPVSVDFGTSFGSSDTRYLPLAWRGNELWLLAGTDATVLNSGKAGPTPYRVARNWNRAPFPVIQKALRDRDIVALSPANTDYALSDGGDLDTHLQLWQDGKLRRHLSDSGHRNSLNLMGVGRPRLFSFSPDGKRLVIESQLYGYSNYAEVQAGFCTHGLALFNVATGKQIVRQNAREGAFMDFAWSPDSKEVAAIGADGWVFVLDGQSGKLRLKFRAHQFFGAQILWAPDGQTLITATNPRSELSPNGLSYDFKTGEGVGVNAPGATITAGSGKNKRVIATHTNGDTTWNGRTERLLKRFDARTGKQIGSALSLQTGAVDLAFSPDGRQLAIGEHEFALILDAGTLATERRLNIPPPAAPSSSPIPAPVCVAWSEDGATLATSTERSLTLWRTR